MTELPPLEAAVLPPGVRARFVSGVNGLRMHLLEAGFEAKDRPCILLLHGFPELAYSWRKVMLPLAAAGFHVVAPDQRGYGRTTGWDDDYDGDLAPFRMLNIVRDTVGLTAALGHRSVAAVVGHDFGSPVAAWCALLRPDIFRSAIMMSAPFGGLPALRLGEVGDVSTGGAGTGTPPSRIQDELARLDPPRKHYHWYYATREANADMRNGPQGVHAFLRAYYHHKSADWERNKPYPLNAWSADELAKLPTYYIMERDKSMAETVAPEMPSAAAIARCAWLPEDELRVYAAEFARTGFQGGLNWYRCRTSGRFDAELEIFAGRAIDVPSCFIAGTSDWGVYQKPGDFERMQTHACTRMLGCHLVDGAGHWVQQEQPQVVTELIIRFLEQASASRSQRPL
jgi:pimeloyl-ACP methyl ester carboxylesterase